MIQKAKKIPAIMNMKNGINIDYQTCTVNIAAAFKMATAFLTLVQKQINNKIENPAKAKNIHPMA